LLKEDGDLLNPHLSGFDRFLPL